MLGGGRPRQEILEDLEYEKAAKIEAERGMCLQYMMGHTGRSRSE